MNIENAIALFDQWLKDLEGGQATFYGILLTTFIGLLVWFIKRYLLPNSNKKSSVQIKADNGSIAVQNSNDNDIQVINQNINIKEVKASHGGTATGVTIGKNDGQKEEQDNQDGN